MSRISIVQATGNMYVIMGDTVTENIHGIPVYERLFNVTLFEGTELGWILARAGMPVERPFVSEWPTPGAAINAALEKLRMEGWL